MKSGFVLVFAAVVAALVCISSGSVVALTLVSDGVAKSLIVVDDSAADSVKLAANQLQEYIRKVSGATLHIVNSEPTDSPGTALIFVGESEGTRARNIDPNQLKPEGYRIVVADNWMAIVGRDYKGTPIYGIMNPWNYHEVYNAELKIGAFGEAGTLYGVYNFLENACGIRWYMHGDIGEVVPTKKDISVPASDRTKSPDFGYRYPWLCNFAVAPEEALWFRRVGFGAPAPVQINHSLDFPMRENPGLKDEHPEYFALIEGERDFTNLSTMLGHGNLCLSNPGVHKMWVDYICNYFEKNPDQLIYPLSPGDGMMKICECSDCKVQLSPQLGKTGMFSNYVWKFVDSVAREVGEKFPDKMVGCIAYEFYNAPPDNITTLSPNTAVMICKTRGSYVNKEYHERIDRAIADWAQKTKNIYCWEYYLYSWPPWRALPVAFPHIISADFKHLRGVSRGEFVEAESNMPSDEPDQPIARLNYPGMAHLNLYVTAKCMWDADTDVDKLLDEYFALFYGPAKKDMQDFWTRTEQIWGDSAGKRPINLYTSSRLQELSGCLARAINNTESGSIYRQRVELINTELTQGKAKMLGTQGRMPSELTIPRVQSAVSLDTGYRAPVWRQSASAGFAHTDGSPADASTIMYALADPEALVFTFIMNEPEMSKLQAKATKQDQTSGPAIWEDDCIDIFLYTDIEKLDHYYRFTVNANSALLDLRMTGNDTINNAAKWNSQAQVKSQREGGRWILQVRIPLSRIGLSSASAGTKMLANFYRNRTVGSSAVLSSWTHVPSRPKVTPELFGTLILGE